MTINIYKYLYRILMSITFDNSNISVQYSTGSNYIIETVKSDLYRRNEIVDTIVRDNLQTAPVTPIISIQEGSNVYAVESYTYSGTANTADFTRVFPTNTTCDILIVGGGGAGGNSMGGGGGAGGVVYTVNQTFQAGTYNIFVGKGGIGLDLSNQDQGTAGVNQDGKDSYIQLNGTDVSLSMSGVSQSLRGYGGGGGGVYYDPAFVNGRNGGSGGGCSETNNNGFIINTAGSATQGNTLWNGSSYVAGGKAGRQNTTTTNDFNAGGGGGAGNNGSVYKDGNAGVQINITGVSQFYAAGGGGGQYEIENNISQGIGGSGIGGNGRIRTSTSYLRDATSGVDGTGSGGGGGSYTQDPDLPAGSGGSGIVIIRYLLGTIPSNNLLTNANEPIITSPTFTETIRTFVHSGGAETQTTHTITLGRDTICDILIVGGGGAGGKDIGAGGGGGAVLYGANISIAAGTYIIKVGRGGTPGEVRGQSSEAFGATLLGGGCAGNVAWGINTTANSGGSGSGGPSRNTNMSANVSAGTVGTSTKGTILTTATLYNGNIGGTGITQVNGVQSSGGGGAGAVGGNGNGSGTKTGNGGAGVLVNITGVNYYWGGGGGGGGYQSTPTDGGRGGGGAGERNDGQGSLGFGTGGADAYNAPVNMNGGAGSGGGGGGSGYTTTTAGNGGSGIVIIKLKSFTGPILEGITHKRLNFAFDSLGYYFDATKYTEYQAQLKTGVGGWRIVRFLPPNLGRWYSGNNFTSTSVNSTNIGTAYNYTNEWGVPFGTFDEMFFGTFDMTYWLRCLKTSVLGTYDNALRPIISSSSSSTPYSARWYQRDSAIHEPWVSITDHNSVPQLIVYGENGNLGGTGLINAYGGMCVLVRDSATATTISIPNTYTINFPVPTIADINNNSNIVLRGAYDIALSTSNAVIIPKTGQYIPQPTTFTNYSVERMYPPVRNFSAATTTLSGQTYGNGTYVVSYSSTYGSGYDPFKCFNTSDIAGGIWADNRYTAGNFNSTSFIVEGYLGDWLKIQLPVAIKLTRFEFLMRNEGSALYRSRSPKDFKIYGSNDGITWVELVTKIDAVYNASYIYEQTTPEITRAYSFYALVVNKLFSTGVLLNFDEWYIYGQEVLPSSLSLRYNLLNPTQDPIGAQWTYSSNNTNVYHMGSVGIGTTSPEYHLDVRGNIFSSTGGFTQSGLTTWSITSDRRIKENIVKASYEKCLENIKNIELYNFNFKDNYVSTNDRHQLGFIAQEVQQVYPKAVEVGKMMKNNGGTEDILTLNTTQIKYTLYGAVKKLIEKVDNIESKINNLYDKVFITPIIETSNIYTNNS